MIDTTGLPLAPDGVHFAMPGLSELGKQLAKALRALPPASAPGPVTGAPRARTAP
jgi:hypothetical protein